mmetsp:Transcript_3608/g.9566  ORF Transcript_3608/g.9566 Transcript_3608/m.9566 type:complete len:99 (+) Transcript_3608:645-941(+)
MTLFCYWEQLEQRTYDIICILQHAAEYHCETNSEQQRQQQVQWDKSSRSRRTAAKPPHTSPRSFDSSRDRSIGIGHDDVACVTPIQTRSAFVQLKYDK